MISEVSCAERRSESTVAEKGSELDGLAFQVPDVLAGAQEVVAGGGQLSREPQPEGEEPPHLAMCVDPEGNEFMLTRKRG